MITSQRFRYKVTNEIVICDNIYLVRWFNNQAHLSVRKEGDNRKFLVLRDDLEIILV